MIGIKVTSTPEHNMHTITVQASDYKLPLPDVMVRTLCMACALYPTGDLKVVHDLDLGIHYLSLFGGSIILHEADGPTEGVAWLCLGRELAQALVGVMRATQ